MRKAAFLSLAAVLILSSCGDKAEPDSYDTANSLAETSTVSVSVSTTQTTSAVQMTEMSTTSTSSAALKEEPPAEDIFWVTVNGTAFKAKFCDTKAAEEFRAMLPLTFDMSELNGNEKYIYTDTIFTTSTESVGHINKGEIMLYGDSCVVLFYDSFDTPYSYTALGYIENVEGLEKAVGAGSVTVTFGAG